MLQRNKPFDVCFKYLEFHKSHRKRPHWIYHCCPKYTSSIFRCHLQQGRHYIFAISFQVFFTKPTGVGGITVSGLTVGPGSGCDSGDPALDSSGITAGGSGNRGGISQRGAVPSYTSDPYR